MDTRNHGIRQKTVGISFSGGGIAAWAEVAVYKDLVRQGIEVDAVVGTSMGSFIAAAVASEMTPEEIEDVIQDTDQAIKESNIFEGRKALLNFFSFRQSVGIVLMEKLAEVIRPVNKLYGEVMLSEVPKPLAIPAVDIISNRLIVFSNQPEYFQKVYEDAEFYDGDIPLVIACLASSAYPVILSPVILDDYQLVDGGVLMNSPASLLSKEKIEYVFAIRHLLSDYDKPADRRVEVGLRAINVMICNQEDVTTASADQQYFLELDLPDTFQFGNSKNILDAGTIFVEEHPIDTRGFYELIPGEELETAGE